MRLFLVHVMASIRAHYKLYCCMLLLTVAQFASWQNNVTPHSLQKPTGDSETLVRNVTTLPAKTVDTTTTTFPLPKVVILPGPHKTGSTSLQRCMVDWTIHPDRVKEARDAHERSRKRWTRFQQRQKRKGKPYEEHMPADLAAADPVLDPMVLQSWSWPAPLSSVLHETGLRHTSPPKAFASLMTVADHQYAMVVDKNSSIPSAWQQERVLEVFQDAMVDAWTKGYNIVFGSEGFDRISHPQTRSSAEVMDTVLEILPWEIEIEKATKRNNDTVARDMQRPTLTIQDLEAVVVYRAPRIEQLKSLWNEIGQDGNEQSFQDFLSCKVPEKGRFCLRRYPNVFDPLMLALEFVNRGIRVTVVDTKGVEAIANMDATSIREKTNLCHVVACNVLGNEPCTINNKVQALVERTANITDELELGNVDVSTQRFNKREDTRPINLTEHQWGEIEKVLQEFDCGFQKALLASPLFRILFQYSIFATCDDGDVQQRPISWLIDRIGGIAGSDV